MEKRSVHPWPNVNSEGYYYLEELHECFLCAVQSVQNSHVAPHTSPLATPVLRKRRRCDSPTVTGSPSRTPYFPALFAGCFLGNIKLRHSRTEKAWVFLSAQWHRPHWYSVGTHKWTDSIQAGGISRSYLPQGYIHQNHQLKPCSRRTSEWCWCDRFVSAQLERTSRTQRKVHLVHCATNQCHFARW